MPQNGKGFFNNFMTEFKKIVWPTKAEVIKKTFVVILISVIIGIIIYGFNAIYNWILIKLVQG